MATANPFDLLGDDDSDDLSMLIAAQKQKVEPKKLVSQTGSAPGAKQFQSQNKAPAQAKLPSKPVPPAQFVRESRSESDSGGRGYGRGRGAGRVGRFYRDSSQGENSHQVGDPPPPQGESNDVDTKKSYERQGGYSGPRVPFRGSRRDGFSNNGEVIEGEREPRPYERRSGTGRGNEMKRDGSGHGNWGSQGEVVLQADNSIVNESDKGQAAEMVVEKTAGEEPSAVVEGKEAVKVDAEEKEAEVKEMTLEEYEKVLEEKRKCLHSVKTEERKVDMKVFESMQQLSNKKTNDDIFIKLGSDKDKKKELGEKAKKSVSINEFLKPSKGENYNYYTPGRGRARGRGTRDGSIRSHNAEVPSIGDPGEFPTLGVK